MTQWNIDNVKKGTPSLLDSSSDFPWKAQLKRKMKIVAPCLGKYRPVVDQCCDKCTPYSRSKKKQGKSSQLGFQSLLNINETRIRYRGWLVRRVCCVLFVKGCTVFPSPVSDRLARVCQSNRVQEALTAEPTAPEEGDSQGQFMQLSAYVPLINTSISAGLLRFVGWLMLKTLSSVFCSVQVNLNHIRALRQASEKGSLLMYVCMRQSIMDCILLSLVLFCHRLRVPYTLCPVQIHSSLLRSVLRKMGVVLLPPGTLTEQDAEMDGLYSPVMTSLVSELLREGQAISVSVSWESGQGGQWLARVRQVIKEGAVSDVCLVPVGISYDQVPDCNLEFGLKLAFRSLWSLVCGRSHGIVRIHLPQPFSLKEMCETGRCKVDGGRPLQDLLLPAILNKSDAVFGQRMMSWLLPSHYVPELDQSERDLSVALTLHLIYSTTSCMAVMSTSLVSSLLLHRHRKGVCISTLCRDVEWLIEEVLFRNKDVGFGGSLVELVHHSLTLLSPHLIIAAVPSRMDPLVVVRPTIPAILSLSNHAQIVTHTFILEAVGACTVSAILSNAAASGVGSRVRRDGVEDDEVKSDSESDVELGQAELEEKALQLCHILPPGFKPPCQFSLNFAMDTVDCLVRCGILAMIEAPRDASRRAFWKMNSLFSWTAADSQYHSDSESEEQCSMSYKIRQPVNFPEMHSYLCSMLAGYLWALRWATEALDLLQKPLPEAECVSQIHSYICGLAKKDRHHYESCGEEMARTAVRTLTDLGVLVVEQQGCDAVLRVSSLFQLADNRKKLHHFISQYICDMKQ